MPAAVGSLRTGAVLRAALLAVLDALGIQHTAQHVVTHAGKVAHTPAADQHNRVLLQGGLRPECTKSLRAGWSGRSSRPYEGFRVRLLRGRGINASANAALLRVLLHRRDLALGLLRNATLADQLVDSRHEVLFTLVVAEADRWRGMRFPRNAQPAAKGTPRRTALHEPKTLHPDKWAGLLCRLTGLVRRTAKVARPIVGSCGGRCSLAAVISREPPG